jgi:hypothetical protein
MIAKPMSLLGSAGSNLTTNPTPFSAHDSIIWPIYGAAVVGMDSTTQICKQPKSRLNVCNERLQVLQEGPRLLRRSVAGHGNFQQPLRSIKLG